MSRQPFRPRGAWVGADQRAYDAAELAGWSCRHGVVVGSVLRPWLAPPTPACPHCRRDPRAWLTPEQAASLPMPAPPPVASAEPSLFGGGHHRAL